MASNQQDNLSNLFDTLADYLATQIKTGNTESKILDIARQFLRDNGYQAKASANSALGSLASVVPFPSEEIDEDELKEIKSNY